MTSSVLCNTKVSIVSGGHFLMVMTEGDCRCQKEALVPWASDCDDLENQILAGEKYQVNQRLTERCHLWENEKKTDRWERIGSRIQSLLTWSITSTVWGTGKKYKFITRSDGGSDLRNSIKKASAALTGWQPWLKPSEVIWRAVHVIWIYETF